MKFIKVNIDPTLDVVNFAEIAFIVDGIEFSKDLSESIEKVKEFSKGHSPDSLKRKLVNELAIYLCSKYDLGDDMLLQLALIILDEKIEVGNLSGGRILSGKNIKKIMGIAEEIKTELDAYDFIQLDRLTTKEQLLNLYKDYRKKIPKSDTRGRIVRDRDWYWLHKEGNSYQEILEMEQKKENGEKITKEGITRAVKRYEKKLTMNV